jgi:two-component system response regulator RegX3
MTKVMVVDDEYDDRQMIEKMLQKEGFETAVAEDGSEFILKVDDFHPDLVTLDIMMPGLNTKEILQKLKNNNCNPKIILITVLRFSQKEKQEFFKLGNVVDYIIKPFEYDEFINAVKRNI